MAFKVTLWERDDMVGHPDARQLRSWVLATVDTLPHADRIARQAESSAHTRDARTVTNHAGTHTERTRAIVQRGRADGYGDVYRTTWISVSVADTAEPNGSTFATEYLRAASQFMDAIANPSGDRFRSAMASAIRADRAGANDTERGLAQSLYRDIRDTAPDYSVYL